MTTTRFAPAARVSPVPVSDPIEAQLRELVAAAQRTNALLEGLRADLAGQKPGNDDVRFVTAIAAASAGHVFSIAELRAHALIDPDLQRAIGGLTNQRLGKRLRDLAGRDIGGFVVTRVTRDETGVVWAVSATPDLHANAGIGC